MALVSLAGPFSNVVLGALAATILRVAPLAGVRLGVAEQFLWIFMIVNFSLAAFNMVPLPPLDGSRILAALLPPFWRPMLAQLERYGVPILLLILVFGRGLGGSIIGAITNPVLNLLLGIFGPGR
jgi:Zn-dependent protease